MPTHISKHIHLLGIGSSRRMVPTVLFKHAGFYKDCLISYDSTKHTSGLSLGKYQIGGHMLTLLRTRNRNYEIVEADVLSKAKSLFGLDLDAKMLYHVICGGAKEYSENYLASHAVEYQIHVLAVLYLSIHNFIRHLQLMLTDRNAALIAAKEQAHCFSFLNSIRDQADFTAWLAMNEHTLQSKAVRSAEGATSLEDLFQ